MRFGQRRVGSRAERDKWRMVLVGGVAAVLSLAALSTHPNVIQASHDLKGVVAPRRLTARRLDEETCLEEHEEFCTLGGLVENACLFEESFEGACCLENAEEPDDFYASELCITNEEETCPPEDLCVAELVPGSGIGAECLQDFEKNGGIPLYLFLLLYLFVGLAIICDDYFAYSLEQLGDYLGLSSDVKGATFAAIGSSAPELFVSLADNVISNPPKSVGVGTIVGSAIFNILVIIGGSAVVAGNKYGNLKLSWKPIARDSLFYLISIAGLVGVALTDDEAEHFEGAILLFLYGGYLAFMYKNQTIFAWMDTIFPPTQTLSTVGGDETALDVKKDEAAPQVEKEEAADTQKDEEAVNELTEAEEKADGEKKERKGSIVSQIAIAQGPKEEGEELGPYWSSLYAWPQKESDDETATTLWLRRTWFIICYPFNLLFRLTIPDSQYDIFGEDKDGETGQRKYAYWAEFTACVIHIAIFSHMLVFSAAKFGCLAGIEPSVMGLTILAAGTSVPDAITSIILTGRGEGDAAVANSIGSNVFDILIGLGLPWFLAGFIYGGSAVATDDIVIAIVFLVLVLVILLGALYASKFHLNKYVGYFLLVLYGLYVIFELFIRDLVV